MSKPEVENKKIGDMHFNIDNLDLKKLLLQTIVTRLRFLKSRQLLIL